ncbi:MAG: peptidase S13 [Chromatiaceae bacterium]|nr:MAG: peptidase S13 [Chromatiaceae bacterium]
MRAVCPTHLLSLLLGCLLLLGLPLSPGAAHAQADPIASALALANASLQVQARGRTLIARQADQPMIPASTMKLVTALAAIDRWGLDHRFATRFYRAADGRLWVRGGGDPYLVSEELTAIASALRQAGLRTVTGIGLDDSLFPPVDGISGRSAGGNPYNAPVTALAANFNTVNLAVAGGAVRSAEAQTPLTATARRIGQGLAQGNHRVHLQHRDNALRHFGELLGDKLQAASIAVGSGEVQIGRIPAGAELIYTHRNSRTLEPILGDMLKYSTNFVANSLFLMFGEHNGQSSLAAAQRWTEDWARRRFGWQNFRIEDGAGLSRGNRLSARQLIELLEAFAPYRGLLAEQAGDPAVRAKTGTLTGVSTYAGYVRRGNDWVPFALLINQAVDGGLRQRVASALAHSPSLGRY